VVGLLILHKRNIVVSDPLHSICWCHASLSGRLLHHFSRANRLSLFEICSTRAHESLHLRTEIFVIWDTNGVYIGRLHLKCDGTRWRTGGEVKGNWRMELVTSTLHTASEHGISSITTPDAHTSAASSRLNWRPRLFKWTRPFRRKTKSGFCACAITFQLASNWLPLYLWRWGR